MKTKYKRIVIKIGTSSIIDADSNIRKDVIESLTAVLSGLNQAGLEVLLVTSGAVGVGMHTVGMHTRPSEIGELQALSAIGQSELMDIYADHFKAHDQTVAQLLLTRDVVDYPKSSQNVLKTINTLLKNNVIPIINENDAISVDEFDHRTTFGENDQLAAIVTNFVNADLLIILSDINGLYDANPKKHPDAKLLEWIPAITEQLRSVAGGHGSQFGTGGMETKLNAADLILQNHRAMAILNGQDPSIINQLISGANVGTYFSAERPEGRNNESK
ncbi:glutamate 5-kinase [Nicoliella spurrieriana]|uniref:Glutamate 5-kinase n=1 Tax=Nicoliella spurrieriana TaxID=2925830 RepID=A0A976RRA0_9LACO|nr:glutamate 5-kinase [Nicoliella spurrieriana]UQS86321.1 glutamate 5-kinase [Nicoliella spurrieriana]